MKLAVTLTSILALGLAKDSDIFFQDNLINQINNLGAASWKAGVNSRFQGLPLKLVRKHMGVLGEGRALPEKHNVAENIPESFDARVRWPQCPSIREIRDQGMCGSCWAVAAAEVLTDRLCIHFGEVTHISADDLATCCVPCAPSSLPPKYWPPGSNGNDGCGGGFVPDAWYYMSTTGVVTGGQYNTSKGCRPYQIKPCEHGITGRYSPCGDVVAVTPICTKKCEAGYSLPYDQDKHYAASNYSIPNDVEKIQTEIMTNGPVETTMKVFGDFVCYKSGIYKFHSGDSMGIHAVRILGWGTEDGTPYWLVANSWNSDWGDNGFFKIVRGQNEVGIEGKVVAGLPKKFSS